MDKSQLVVAVNENKDAVAIELQTNGQAEAHMVYELPELEDLIKALSVARSKLNEAVPQDIDPGTRVEALTSPEWRVRSDLWDQGPVLILRHTGLGWLGFSLPETEAQEMAKCLSDPAHPRKK